MKVFISPQFKSPDRADGGIRRVVEAMVKYLPDYGVEVVSDANDADLINCHAGDLVTYPPDLPLVASCHGLYWSNYTWPADHYLANLAVIENMVRSKVVTAPSLWVAQALRRGIARPIIPIHHGVDPDEWGPGDSGNYVLWNKARADVVSDPGDLDTLAAAMPDVSFISTLGTRQGNTRIIGAQPYDKMKDIIKNAGVYLATARETFGIGTLEAMASGVPVVGWDHGGQSEIVIEDDTGYLVPYGDYEALAHATRTAFENRERLGVNAIADVRERWTWAPRIEQYAAIFRIRTAVSTGPKLTFIVTCYNLGQYLTDCLTSIRRIKFDDWECIIVDDHSTDDTRSVARRFCVLDDRFIYREPEQNLGLSGARNFGFEFAHGHYILPLDADDVLHPEGVFDLMAALDSDPSIHIAYGNLLMMSEDGKEFHSEVSASNEFNWFAQMAHVNQPFYCAMMRREVLGNTGGYRVRDWRAEDAAFWCRATSFGFRAKKVTTVPTIFYRLRPNSKGATERAKYPDGDGDWCAWYGWRMASNMKDGLKALAKGQPPDPALVPFAAQASPPSDVRTWNADHGQSPLISVIIPCGPGHERYLVDALDSLQAQTFANWEAIVCNDTGSRLNLHTHAWAVVVDTDGGRGAGYARNRALEVARGDLVLFLDADDWLLSNAMRDKLTAFVAQGGERYIYSNYVTVSPGGDVKHERMRKYDQGEWHGQHAVTVLMRRSDAQRVGGFDEELIGWEDWDFPLKCAIAGICGYHIPVETFVYRNFSGQRRDAAATASADLLPVLNERYKEFYTGVKPMAPCGCSGKGAEVLMKAKNASVNWLTIEAQQVQKNRSNGMTRMKFIGTRPGSKPYIRVGGRNLSKQYRGGANSLGRYIDADPVDVDLLKSTGEWAIEASAVPATDTNAPAPVAINYAAPTQLAPAEADETVRSITPKALDEAREHDVDLAMIKGSGADGKITVRDVRNAARR